MNRIYSLAGIIILLFSMAQKAAAEEQIEQWRQIEIKPLLVQGDENNFGYGLSVNFDPLLGFCPEKASRRPDPGDRII